MHSCRVCFTLAVDGKSKVYSRLAGCIVIGIVAEKVGQHGTVCHIGVAPRVIRILDSIHPRLALIVHIMVNVQGVNINGIFSVSRHSGWLLKD